MKTEFVCGNIDGAETSYAWSVNDVPTGLKSVHARERRGVSPGVQGRRDFFGLDAETLFDAIEK